MFLPPTPPVTKPVTAEGPSASAMSGGPNLGRAGTTSPNEWTEMTGNATLPSSAPRAEATANDAPTFPSIKEEALTKRAALSRIS